MVQVFTDEYNAKNEYNARGGWLPNRLFLII